MKKSIITTVSMILGTFTGFLISNRIAMKAVDEKGKKVEKFKSYYTILNQWLILKQSNRNLSEYFISNRYKNIAIYGMGELGNRLYDELKESPINIKYGIDREADSVCSEIDILSLDSHFDNVDAVIVTSIFAFNEVQKILSHKLTCPIISLEDIIYEL